MPSTPFLLCKRHMNIVCPFSRQSQHIIPVNHNLKFNRHRLTVYRNYFVFVHTCFAVVHLVAFFNNTLIKKEVNRIYLLLLIVSARFIPIYSQGRSQGGGATAPQSSKKPFFQNVEIRVEKCCWGGGGYLIVKEDQFWSLSPN